MEWNSKVHPTSNFKLGFSHWPNGYFAFRFWYDHVNVANSEGKKIARFTLKSWK